MTEAFIAADYRNVGKELRSAVKAAKLTHTGRLTLHSLRHTYASLLIANGLNVVFVSRQLGHANPTITLTTYAHLFQQAEHAVEAREALEACHATMTSGRSCNSVATTATIATREGL